MADALGDSVAARHHLTDATNLARAVQAHELADQMAAILNSLGGPAHDHR
jgi:hypothetical protein